MMKLGQRPCFTLFAFSITLLQLSVVVSVPSSENSQQALAPEVESFTCSSLPTDLTSKCSDVGWQVTETGIENARHMDDIISDMVQYADTTRLQMDIEKDEANTTLNVPGKALRYTTDDTPKKCKFPFKHQGITYNDCTDHGAPSNQTWCQTDDMGSWGWCQCKAKRYTITGKRCLCPAKYSGKAMQTGGVSSLGGLEWCFTKDNGAWEYVLPENETGVLEKLVSDSCLRAKARFLCAGLIKRCDDSTGKPMGLHLCQSEFKNLAKECGAGPANAIMSKYAIKTVANSSMCTAFDAKPSNSTFAKKVAALRKKPKHVGKVPLAKNFKFCTSEHGVTYEVAREDGIPINETDKRAKDLFASFNMEGECPECQSALKSVICRYMYQRVEDGTVLAVCTQTCENLRGKCGQKTYDALLAEIPACAETAGTNCTGANFHGAALVFEEEPKEELDYSRGMKEIDASGPADEGKTTPLPPEEQMKGPTIINKRHFNTKTFAMVLAGACVVVLAAVALVAKQEALVYFLFPANPYQGLNKNM